MRSKSGFSLVELMIVIVIVGVLSVIAMPAYNKYVAKSKLAEGYTLSGVIVKSEITFFSENNEFVMAINDDPAATHAKNPATLDPTSTFQDTSTWQLLGYPIAIGSSTKFSFMVVAAKYDSSATQDTAQVAGNSLSDLNAGRTFVASYTDGSTCNNGWNGPVGSILGLSAQANYDVAIISAVGDLNQDRGELCTAMATVIEATAANQRKTSTRAPIIFYPGN